METVNTIGLSIIGLFLLFILLKRPKQLADYLLIGLNLFLAALMTSSVWINQELTSTGFLIQSISSFALNPFFLAYGLTLVTGAKRLKSEWWWIWIYLISFTIFLFVDFTILNDYDAQSLRQLFEDPPLSYHFFYKSHLLFSIGACIWFLRKIKTYQGKIREQYSYIDPIRLLWLRNMTIAYLLIHVLALVTFLIYNFGWIAEINTVFIGLQSATVLSVFYLSFNGIQQYSIANFQEAKPAEDLETPTSGAPAVKYKSSSLSEPEMQQLYTAINRLLEEEQLYLEPKLQVQDIADRLQVTTHRISQTINSIYEKPFYELVNGYRVQHFQKLLLDPSNKAYTILALGLDSGFNSKASLNRIFKQHTGQSPREFQKAHLPVN